MKKYIGVYVGSNRELRFFKRVADSFREIGYRFVFLSNKVSIVSACLLYREKTYLITKTEIKLNIPFLSDCHDVRSGYLNMNEAKILYSAVYEAFVRTFNKFKYDFIFIWNGSSVQTIAAADFAGRRQIKKRYFELSNIPGKIFVNPEGVNAESSLYRNINLLDNYTIKESDYENWKLNYFNSEFFPPQAGDLFRIHNYLFLADVFAFKFLSIPANGEHKIKNKIKRISTTAFNYKYDKYDFKSRGFILYPLQVNLDSQLIRNSDLDNLGAIRIAAKRAEESGLELVVKSHPAEVDDNFLKKVQDLRQELNFFLVDYPINQLIKYASLVITINSTAGLVSKILNKNVEFLGRSFYSLMNAMQMKNYIMSYLVDADYFSDKKITACSAEKILAVT